MTKSSAEHFRDGTFRADRHGNRQDLKLARAKNLDPPEDLDDVGRQLWYRVVDAMPDGGLSELSLEALQVYCEGWSALRKITPIYMANPIDKETRISWKAALEVVDNLGRQFGWSPLSAAKIRTGGSPDDQESDLAKWLKNNNENN